METEHCPHWMRSRSQKALELAAHLRIEELAEQMSAEREKRRELEGKLEMGKREGQ